VKTSEKPKEELPVWVVIFLGAFLTCIFANAITFLLEFGAFSFWKSLPSTPTTATHISEADPDTIWVETKDGQIYTIGINFCQYKNCNSWTLIENPADIKPMQYHAIVRGDDCFNLGIYDSPNYSPGDEIKECIYASAAGVPDPEAGYVTYFALMKDGRVKYWQNGNSLLGFQFFLILSTFVLPIVAVVIISAYYEIRKYLQKEKKLA
jgi:hypothetical protein